jgi:hypothetical protein
MNQTYTENPQTQTQLQIISEKQFQIALDNKFTIFMH